MKIDKFNELRTKEMEKIIPFSQKLSKKAKEKWDGIAKPIDGMGDFEEIICRMASQFGSIQMDSLSCAVIVMCADNGVVEEGISQTDQSVTKAVYDSLQRGTANVCQMADYVKATVFPVNIGIAMEADLKSRFCTPIARGTKNFLKEPAMTKEETFQAILYGAEIVKTLREEGYQLFATGEMGIGNTTTSSALASALTGLPVEEVTGRGSGLTDEKLRKKVQVIQSGIEKYGFQFLTKEQRKDSYQAFQILSCLGGLDLAGLVGVYLGAACYGGMAIIDGVIASVAALLAERIFPGTKNAMLASHMGKEPAMKGMLEELELKPVIHANLALGEGTGAVMMMALIQQALRIYEGNTTFDRISVEAYERL